MENTKVKNELLEVVKTNQLEQTTSVLLMDSFTPFYEQAKQWIEKAKMLKVTDASQKNEIKMAGVARKALKEIRVNADKKRKELKEDSTRYGKAVQSAYNLIESLIKPTEEYLLQKERNEKARIERKLAEVKAKELPKVIKVGVQSMSAEERTEAIVGAVNDSHEKVKQVLSDYLADYLVDDENLLNEVDVITGKLCESIEDLEVEENFEYLFGKIAEMKHVDIEFEDLYKFIIENGNVCDFAKGLDSDQTADILDAVKLNGYVVVKVDNLDQQIRLEEFINSEIHPLHSDQQSKVFA